MTQVALTEDEKNSEAAWDAYQADAVKDDAAFLEGWKGYWDQFSKLRKEAVDAPESKNTQQPAKQPANVPDPSQVSANGTTNKPVSDRPAWIEPELEDGEWTD